MSIVAAWFVVVVVLVVVYAGLGFEFADVSATIAAPGTFVNGALNTMSLLIPEFLVARAIYGRITPSR